MRSISSNPNFIQQSLQLDWLTKAKLIGKSETLFKKLKFKLKNKIQKYRETIFR